jgi:hypothetical protein
VKKQKTIALDFIIKSEPLTNKEQAAISEYIKNYKLKHSKKKAATTRKPRGVNSSKKAIA